VFNATFSNISAISWRPVLVVEEAGVPDKVCQWLAAGQWFSLGTLVSSTNKTDCHDITEMLLKMTLNTMTVTQMFPSFTQCF
jgi:hypothetical protein